MQAYRSGGLPSDNMAGLLGMRLVDATFGAVHLTAQPTAAHTNPSGLVHGGYISTLLDTALGTAAFSTLAASQKFTTLELKVSFLRACRPEAGEVAAHGSVIRHGRRVIFAEAKLVGVDGQTLATASSTLLVLSS